MKLTDAYLRALNPSDKTTSHPDGEGLLLLCHPQKAMAWRYRYRFAGKAKMLSLGTYPEVSLKAARVKREEFKKLLASGIDPSLDRQEKKIRQGEASENSFQAVAIRWHENWKANKSPNHVRQVYRRMEKDLFPHIGSRPINEISIQLLLMVIKKIDARGAHDIAKRAYETAGQVFRYGVAYGLCETNPVAQVKPADFLKPVTQENYKRVGAKELPQLLRDMDQYGVTQKGDEITRLGMQLMAYVFVRTSELIGARWSEIDLEAKEWRIPPERMKMKDPHIVLMSGQVEAIFRRLKEITGGREFVFPSSKHPKKTMSNNTLLSALKRMGYAGKMTGHGFRGIASTILHERGYPHEHIEIQLAHADRNKVSASYNHAKYLPQRKAMLQDWANYLDGLKAGAEVIPIHAKAS
jgi:integrase